MDALNYNKPDKKKSSVPRRILKFFSVVLMLTSAAALILAYLAPNLDPYYFWYSAFCGLVAHLLMIVNVVFLLILGVRLSKWAFVPLVTLMLGLGYVGNFLQVRFVTEYNDEQQSDKGKFTVMTYNVHSLFQYGEKNKSTADDIVRFIRGKNPDIICFQEFDVRKAELRERLSKDLGEWKYQVQSVRPDSNGYSLNLAVFSKYELLNANSIKFSDSDNSSMFVDIMLGVDTIRLFNNHLQSTQFNRINKNKLREQDAEQAARVVGNTLRQNYKIRAFQADTISSVINRSNYPKVVVGDFNDTPMSYVVQTIKGEMKDAFREKGEGYGYTYIPMSKLFRIDFVLHSEELETLSYESPEVTWSDHQPVIVSLKINR